MTLTASSRRIFVALDTLGPSQVLDISLRLGTKVSYKVGVKFLIAASEVPHLLNAIDYPNVFLDLRLQGEPEVVAANVRAAALREVGWLSIHCAGDEAVVKAAVAARDKVSRQETGGYTTLLGTTSLPSSLSVSYLAQMAYEAGLDGMVCLAKEVSLIRAATGPEFTIITSEDTSILQITNAEAIQAGANGIISSPGMVTDRFIAEVEEVSTVQA